MNDEPCADCFIVGSISKFRDDYDVLRAALREAQQNAMAWRQKCDEAVERLDREQQQLENLRGAVAQIVEYTEHRDECDSRRACTCGHRWKEHLGLQLGTIERCIRLWSNPGELVVSPFAGIGSEGYEAIRLGRHFIGFELKPQYASVAVRNLQAAEHAKAQGSLFQAGA